MLTVFGHRLYGLPELMFVPSPVRRRAGRAGKAVAVTGTDVGATDAADRGARRLPRVRGFAAWPPQGSPKEEGKALRTGVPRSAHRTLELDAARPDAVSAVAESNAGRIAELTPLRVGRMAATPFAFLRGSAALMAYDLARTPTTRIGTQICGDAHAANFGLYGDARGDLVIDLNDFDETAHGPWEWDLKRLVASLVLAGREAGADEDTCRAAAQDAAGAYRRTMRLLAKLPVLDAWNAIADEELVSHTDADDLLGTLQRVAEKAGPTPAAGFAAKSTESVPDGGAPVRARAAGAASTSSAARAPARPGHHVPGPAGRRRGERRRRHAALAGGRPPRHHRRRQAGFRPVAPGLPGAGPQPWIPGLSAPGPGP
ncbi:hypothetical protein SCANM63S_02046 [Streptomyces canarius]